MKRWSKTKCLNMLAAMAFAVLAVSQAAKAVVIVQPDPSDRQWVAVGGGNCHGSERPNGTPTCPGGGTASGFIDPMTEFASAHFQNFGATLKGGGSTSANALRIFVESNSGFSFASAAIVDTYTIVGPDTGATSITARITADATAASRVTTIGETFGNATFSLAIGTGLFTSGRSVVNQIASDEFSTGLLQSTAAVPIQLVAEDTFTVTPGVAFNLAYAFTVHGTAGIVANGLNTATIEFDLPDGYSISSTLGFSAGTTSSSDVPEPPALALLASALLLLGSIAFFRRRQAGADTSAARAA